MASITYIKNDFTVGTIPHCLKMRVMPYVPMRVMVTFLPRALQPRPSAGGGGTSHPVSLSQSRINLLAALNQHEEQQEWLIKDTPGWLYRRMNGGVYWSSAIALAGNYVMIDNAVGKWRRVRGVPLDADMTIGNIKRDYWTHVVYVGNMFQRPHEPFGWPTLSPVWESAGRELWIDKAYLFERSISPIERD